MDGARADLDRAVRLFEFLQWAQKLKSRVVRDVRSYEDDGNVVWFHELPDHEAVMDTRLLEADDDPTTPLLSVSRVPHVPAPEPDESLRPWVEGPIDDPDREPELQQQDDAPTLSTGEDESLDLDTEPPARLELREQPKVDEGLQAWIARWRQWAAAERRARPVRQLYRDLFEVHHQSTGRPEELELIVGVGFLAWQLEGETIRRHLVTARAGDHKQVSPAAVGVHEGELANLARVSPRRPLPCDVGRSATRLFDEANMRYGGLITLTEHRQRFRPTARGIDSRALRAAVQRSRLARPGPAVVAPLAHARRCVEP